MNRFCTLLLSSLLLTQLLQAQPTFNTKAYVDVNNVKSAILVHGDMWYDPATLETDMEFPIGSGKTLGFASSLWMGGFDANASLVTAAVEFRQGGTDYWPGMLPDVGPLYYQGAEKWAKIWKVDKNDIITFLLQTNHTVANTPASILEWPAKGNPFAKGNGAAVLTITRDAAPFVDVNGDGLYNALLGDYPLMHGDQMLWWVFNDNAVTPHTVTLTQAMGIEVQAMAYAYSRNTLIDNVVYYEYEIINRSGGPIDSFVAGIWNDCDLGYSHDDYIGFDSSRRLGFVYNGTAVDGQGEPFAYGANPPMAGITLIKVPGDDQLTKVPAGSFMYYNNENSVVGNPSNGAEYYNYLNARFRTGNPLPQGEPYAYALPKTECDQVNMPWDRRFVLAIKPSRLEAGGVMKIVWASVVTDLGVNHSCSNPNFTEIQTVSDTAWGRYNREIATGVNAISPTAQATLTLYPNPAYDLVSIDIDGKMELENLVITDAVGRIYEARTTKSAGKITFDIRHLAPGIYTISGAKGDGKASAVFVKH